MIVKHWSDPKLIKFSANFDTVKEAKETAPKVAIWNRHGNTLRIEDESGFVLWTLEATKRGERWRRPTWEEQ